jgi:hypothetical protein
MCSVASVLVLALGAAAGEKPRVFLTESQALELAGDATIGEAKGAVSFSGGASPQNVEVMREFHKRCPAVIVTASREKADYVIRLDHEATNPATPFVRGNKVAVFDKNQDLIYSHSTRLLRNAVKGACAAVRGGP